VATMDLSTWQGMRARDPRRLVLDSAGWGPPPGLTPGHRTPTADELDAMLGRARDAGVRSIDTARAYGESEARIGRSLHAVPSAEGWRVLTKLAPDVHEEGLGIAETLERVATSLSDSRIALGQDTLPVVLLPHFGQRHACGGKLWRNLLAEREAGRIGSLGVSAATPEEAWAALDDPDIEVLQVTTSLLDLRLLRQDFFPRARELGRTVYVRNIFQEGLAQLAPETLPHFLTELAPHPADPFDRGSARSHPTSPLPGFFARVSAGRASDHRLSDDGAARTAPAGLGESRNRRGEAFATGRRASDARGGSARSLVLARLRNRLGCSEEPDGLAERRYHARLICGPRAATPEVLSLSMFMRPSRAQASGPMPARLAARRIRPTIFATGVASGAWAAATLLLCAIALIAVPRASAAERLVEGIAAQVGNEIVLTSEVLELSGPIEERMRQAGAPSEEIAAMRRDALERLIETKLLSSVVERLELGADRDEVDAAIDAIAADNGLTIEQLLTSVTSHGLTLEEYRSKIRGEIERSKVVNAMVRSRVQIETAEVRALYEERFGDQRDGGQEVYVRHILVMPDDSEASSACQVVREARAEIVSGAEAFTEAAQRVSDLNPERGGDLGWIHRRDLAEWMADIIDGMQPGQLSEVISMPFGCNLLELVDRREFQMITFGQAESQLRNYLFQQKTEVEYTKWLDMLREQTYIQRKGSFGS